MKAENISFIGLHQRSDIYTDARLTENVGAGPTRVTTESDAEELVHVLSQLRVSGCDFIAEKSTFNMMC